MLPAFRKNLFLTEAANSSEARKRWTEQPDINVGLLWNIWQGSNPDLAQQVEMDEPFRIYCDSGVVLTHRVPAPPCVSQKALQKLLFAIAR